VPQPGVAVHLVDLGGPEAERGAGRFGVGRGAHLTQRVEDALAGGVQVRMREPTRVDRTAGTHAGLALRGREQDEHAPTLTVTLLVLRMRSD
jgi:hypothetical protein